MPPAPLLALLPSEERDRLQSLMRRVTLENAQTLVWPNGPIESVHFPIDAVVSAVAHGEGGESVEAGLIGCEGVAGLPLFLRQRTSSLQLQCQVPGEAWRMRAEDFIRESAAPGPLQHALFGYAHGFLAPSPTSSSPSCSAPAAPAFPSPWRRSSEWEPSPTTAAR